MPCQRIVVSLLFLLSLSTTDERLAARLAWGGELPPEQSVKPVEVVRTGDYSEGVAVDREGYLYFSHEKIITRVTPAGDASTWAVTGSPNGHKVLADGTHLVCDASRPAVLHLDVPGFILIPAATESDGRPLRRPNDLTLDHSTGGVYFTDPALSDETHSDGTIHYLDPNSQCRTVGKGLAYPTGIAMRSGGKELLVAESKRNRILAFPVLEPGKLGDYRVLVDLPGKGSGQIDNQPFGIALDTEGNVYIAHYGMRQIQVVNPEGKLVRRYPAGNLTVSNVAFAGPEMNRLYITGGEPGALFRLDLPGVKGLNTLPPPSTKTAAHPSGAK